MESLILLNPGPTNTFPEVKEQQNRYTDTCHRTREFEEIYSSLKSRLLTFFAGHLSDEWEVVILAGSGTSALESMIVSLVPEGVHLLVAGKYGDRAANIFQSYNIGFTQEVCQDVFSTKSGDNTNVYFVENETTTGEKFSLKEMTQKFPKASFFIDATSAFGATDYYPYLDKIKAISFCSNKCLQAPAGLGVVIYRKDAKIQKRPSYTLNVQTYRDKMPFTIPPQLVAALEKSLSNYKNQETIFNTRRDRLIEDFEKLGIKCVNAVPSNSIVGFQHPKLSYDEIEIILKRLGIVIYSGVPGISRSFRVATMSVLFDSHYEQVLEAFRETCVR